MSNRENGQKPPPPSPRVMFAGGRGGQVADYIYCTGGVEYFILIPEFYNKVTNYYS